MKVLGCVFVSFAFVALTMVGCSDKSESPVAPVDKATLQKVEITYCDFFHHPIAPPEGGEIMFVDDKFIMKNVKITEWMESADTMITGTLVHYLNEVVNVNTGEGNTHGKWILTPDADVGGGVWEGTYTGKRIYSPGVNPGLPDYQFVTPLKLVAVGKGGTINGMQFKGTTTIYSWGIIVEGWYGIGDGYYKSH